MIKLLRSFRVLLLEGLVMRRHGTLGRVRKLPNRVSAASRAGGEAVPKKGIQILRRRSGVWPAAVLVSPYPLGILDSAKMTRASD
jgi:hypothetical protein